MASPKATWPLKAFSLSAGLDVRIRFAIDISLPNANISLRRNGAKFKTRRRAALDQFQLPRLSGLDSL
jgi:hypothetical protein